MEELRELGRVHQRVVLQLGLKSEGGVDGMVFEDMSLMACPSPPKGRSDLGLVQLMSLLHRLMV